MNADGADLYRPSLDERYDVYRMRTPMSPWPLLFGVLVGGFFIAGLGLGENFRRLGDKRAGLLTFAAGLALTLVFILIFRKDLVHLAKVSEGRHPPAAAEPTPDPSAAPTPTQDSRALGTMLCLACNLVAFLGAWPVARYQRRFTSTWERSGRSLGGGVAWIIIAIVAYHCLWISAVRELVVT